VVGEIRNTIDLDVQYRTQSFDRHDLLLGFGYRYSWDQTMPGKTTSFNPRDRGIQLFSAFLQDDIALLRDELTLTLGSKLEHNDFTGFEAQPTAKLLWRPVSGHSLWFPRGAHPQPGRSRRERLPGYSAARQQVQPVDVTRLHQHRWKPGFRFGIRACL
jgi:outer membrane receptor protein involved in Fe transport